MNASQEGRTLWIAVFAGLLAMFLLYSYTNEKSQALSKKFGTTQRVVVALQDIPEMATVNETMLEVVEKPVEFIQPQAVRSPQEIIGYVALAPLQKGEQVLSNKLSPPDETTGLSIQVTPKRRAVTLPVDDIRGVAKLIIPGDRVDILSAIEVGKGLNKTKVVRTILQNVTVLATGPRITNQLPALQEEQRGGVRTFRLRGDTSFSNLTVEVTPTESQKLIYILATAPGSLFLTLRHPTDTKLNSLSVTTQDTVLERPSFKKEVKKARRNLSSGILRPTQAPKPKTKPKPQKKKGPFIDL